jgi:AcrR family transcriptional regulator
MPPRKKPATTGQETEVSESRAPDTKNRRALIVAALRRCMISKGYAETSLTDLAKAAQMSVSHLLYYYASKEAVLLDLSMQLNEQILLDIGAHHQEPPEERIHVLVDNVFVHGAITRGELGLVREIIALSTHRPALRASLENYARRMIDYLEDLFSKTPRQPGLSAVDAAEIAGALWIGLVINTDYDARLDNNRARRLFRRSLLSLANLDPSLSFVVKTPVPSSVATDAPPASKPRVRKPRAATPGSST